ncbi:prepilin-type N-terminal cleavage/methylation domain-containing protein [Paenibacillus sp. FSL H8-0548]|uniref:prepilin-type N-terminal cleavage/methylation domain-containing protein n=1 Tax=Paenibacillus sp. FSL H8-0548 TaxID=1920422 RepID=UPI001C4B56B4|nr:prepilin-type N-terminal cleavage/methylation domain-containing protein [Paenibacillus sp. FSL H8-0548]
MLMALKRNEKGLTLIELLAVLVIVGIIAAIAIPAIGGTIEKSKTKADTASELLITEAAVRYMIDSETATSSATTVSIDDLVSGGYLSAEPTFNKGGNTVSLSPTKTNGVWKVTISRTT